ncbi:PREDICTED: vitellogenin-2-like [Pterocles gutturalis]|uniref:vitellogenin-2-like n=1 Tax=Pterocles gutturalis TaxID=240206 RepID=UPI0005286500|nr:PREDICTED: vitellogenin-2-like [Pterocles gutturalis]
MKGLILALALALAGGQRQDLEPVFHTGKTYLYGYESSILHGLPGRGLAMAGIRLTCQLEISRVSHSDHLLQIRSPKLKEYNGFWPTDPFTLSSKLTETLAACFSQAFKFEYTEGRVGSIFAPEDCPILCTNLVRGILNMIQITIKKSQNVYELQEAGIEGICQTRYVIQDDSKNNRATISKSKDLTDCQEKAVKNMGMAYIRPCPTCPLKVRNIKGTVMFTYKMKYDNSGALMMSATSEQVYQISPFNEPNEAAVMEARQELSLVDIKRTPIRAPKTQLQNQGSLRYHFSGELLQMPIPLLRIKNTDLQLTETLQQLVQNNEEGATKEASAKFLQMVQLFRIATLDQIESLWVQFANELSYRHWFLSAICAAGTTDTFRFLKQKIHDEKLNIWEASVTLPLAFHFVTPNKQTLEVASSFLTCPQIHKAPMHRIIVYLGYGSMVNKYCAQTSICPNELLQPLHDLATEATSKGDVKDMALALKAIGNAGEPASIKRILKFLPPFSWAAASLPNRIHADAVLALRKMARKDPAKVREISLQIFMDNTLDPNVRMVACIVLFETKPGLPTVTAMASSLLTEPSLQVASFTYSHMKALAVGRIPQLYNLSAACNIAIKLLSPRLDRLSYRYSKVIHVGGYSSEYQAGAIWRVYLMNSPNTMFPSDIITKVRGYYANTATDIIEVAFRSQSLSKLIRKQNIPFAEYDTYKTLKELGKTLLGWKELPPEDPLVSAYIKVLGQEIAFLDIDKDAIQQTMMSLTGTSDWQPVAKKVVEGVQRGISGQWTLPAMVGELRHIVPTVVGMPLELGLCGVALARAVANVDIQISPPLSDNFRPSQLLENNMDIHADIKPKAYFHIIAMMGINTQYFQSGLEFHADFSANSTMKFDARINMKEKNLKIETPPCREEVELAAVRSEVYAISRNMEELDSEKKSQLLPKGEVPSISDHPFQPSERASSPGSWKESNIPSVISKGYHQGSEEALHHSVGGRLYARIFCRKFESLGCSACLSLKSRNSAFLRNTYLHKLVGELEAKVVLKPVHTDADIDKIQLEIQAGSKAASKIIDVASSRPKEEDETSLYEDIQAKLKKILGIENVFKVTNKTRHHKRRIRRKEKTAVIDLWAEPSAAPLSSSSSSTASSVNGKEPGNEHKKDEIRQSRKKPGSSSRRSSSSSSSSASNKICSSSGEDHSGHRHCSGDSEYSNQQADLPIYQFWFKPADEQDPGREVLNSSISSSSSSAGDEGISRAMSQPKFLGDSKPPILAAVLRAIHRNEQPTGLQLVLYTDTQPMRSRIQMFVSSITGPSRWKLCADASVVNSYKVSGSLKWGEDCQDYQVAAQIATGQFAAYPAMQVKLEWPKVSSTVRVTARWFYSFLPGAAYILGYSQRERRGPSHQATLVMALTSPRTCDVVLKLPELTIYDRAIRLPLPFPSSPGTPISTLPSPDRNIFSQVTLSIIENLKAHCSVFQSTITTFNGVEFNYSMPANCYHVLVQDCSPELKFLVMMKRPEESTDLTAVNVRLASHEVEMYVSNGLIQMKINGVQTRTDVPYTSNSDASMLISSEKEGLSLKAPDYGIDKLYYDGHRLEIQVAFWMAGKTCGICGKYDAEKEREYQMPSGYLAKDAVSFGQSWIISEDPCAGACKLQRKFVKIEKPVAFEKKAAKCFSVEPVLHCVEGCSATRTAPVSVGFHCVPADSALSLEGQTRLDQKSEDVVSTVPAHTACSCQQHSCPA